MLTTAGTPSHPQRLNAASSCKAGDTASGPTPVPWCWVRTSRSTTYWMDSSQFRIARGRRRLIRSTSVTGGHWWAAMQAAGLGRDPVQIGHLVLATTYGLLSRGKGMQHVYRDAHLRPGATAPEDLPLPDAVQRRIRAASAVETAPAAAKELDEVFGLADIPAADVAATARRSTGSSRAASNWFRSAGDDGLEVFLKRLDAWSMKHRKKGGNEWLRRFLNVFGYECKASFNLCYANAWIGLIPWLREHRGLDDVSERFLRLWHMQNQPIDRPDGTVGSDVFNGQVLSLHPLSGFFMKNPSFFAVAGRFFASEHREGARAKNRLQYWELVGAILTAAHLYRQAAEHAGPRARRPGRCGVAVECVAAGSPDVSEPAVFEDFAVSQGVVCSNCSKQIRFAATASRRGRERGARRLCLSRLRPAE